MEDLLSLMDKASKKLWDKCNHDKTKYDETLDSAIDHVSKELNPDGHIVTNETKNMILEVIKLQKNKYLNA